MAQGTPWKRRLKICESFGWVMEEVEKIKPSKHSNMKAHLNLQRLWAVRRGPAQVSPDEVPELRGKLATNPHP